jgi:energy-coupling factor transporter transmembrane protein EcfT
VDLYYIDYISVTNRSFLHRTPVGVKMAALALIIAVLMISKSPTLNAAVAGCAILLALACRIPLTILVPLMLYPTLFLAILFLSARGLTLAAATLIVSRVLAITGSVVLFVLSTSYPAIFGALGRVLPGFIVAALFVISDGIENVRIAMHLRGGINWRHPLSTLRNFGMALGHFLVHSIEGSRRMADSLKVRGFANRVYYLEGRR